VEGKREREGGDTVKVDSTIERESDERVKDRERERGREEEGAKCVW